MHAADSILITVAVAAVAGLLAQVLGHRLRVPAIVLLLAFGVALGPSGLGLVHPDAMGAGLSVLVKLGVAVILFDGALNLRLSDLGQAIVEVRRLVTVGLLTTWVGATLAALWIAGLSWRVAIVFGALVTVTGPTVVQPILRRVRLPRHVKTILEGEAILIDPVGAVLAVAAVDIIVSFTGVRPIGIFAGVWAYFGRLVVGLIIGGVGGFLLSWMLKRRGVIPAELANLVSLAGVWGVFALAETVKGEAGIMAAVAMGLAMQRSAVPEERRLRRFKEQLTVLGISLLFVLLAANLPLDVVREEGWGGIGTVAALMFIVRPASVWLALRKSDLSLRERLFVAWIAPRGIVAASVASLFALEMTEAGLVEGDRLLAIAFLTIAATVTIYGLTAVPVARLLRLESFKGRRAIIVGAGALGLELARSLRRHHRPVVVIDRNRAFVERARADGFEIVEGNALDESVLGIVGADEADTLVALTANSEVNALAAHLAHDAFGVANAYPLLSNPARGAGPTLLERVGGDAAFGKALDVRAWDYALERDEARLIEYRLPAECSTDPARREMLPEHVVLLARVRGDSIEVATANLRWRADDVLVVLTSLSADGTRAVLDEVLAPRATETAVTNA
jgi:NhaP-type Na+/H+ or K+/H+ antiporter